MHFRLCPTLLDKFLIWHRVVLVDSYFVGYEIDFEVLISYETHERSFEDMTTLPFHYLSKSLCDKVGLLGIPDIDRRVEAMRTTHTSMIKYLVNPVPTQRVSPPSIVVLTHFEGPSVQVEHVDRLDVHVDMGKHRDLPEVYTKGERAPTTSTSVSASTFKPVGVYTMPPYPASIATTLGFIALPCKFLQCLMERKDKTISLLIDTETQLSNLYAQIHPSV